MPQNLKAPWPCRVCERPISRASRPDVLKHVDRGLCGACYRVEQPQPPKRPTSAQAAPKPRARRINAIVQIPTLRETSWTERAVCRGADTEAFSAEYRERGVPDRAILAARRYCARCPVLDECRTFAERFREQGLWAGEWRIDQTVTPIRTKTLPGRAVA